MIHITDSITIFENQIDFKAIRSSGPGGQHVNKVSTAISLKYDVLTQTYRSQARNKDDALTRLIHLFKQSAIRPIKRMKTIPAKSVNQNRLNLKKLQSKKKILRKPPKLDE